MMRVWDNELLLTGNPFKTETIRVSERMTDAQAIYNAYIAPYLTGVTFLRAVVIGNEENGSALQSVDAFCGETVTQCVFTETNRQILPSAGYAAILAEGAEITVRYIQANSVQELLGNRLFEQYTDTAQAAYTLSSGIYENLVASHVPQTGTYAVCSFPETMIYTARYLRMMECNNLNQGTAEKRFTRYGTGQIYNVSASYAATLNSGENLVTLVLNYDKLGG